MGRFHNLEARLGYIRNTLTGSALIGTISLYSIFGCCPNQLPFVPNEIPVITDNGENPIIGVIENIIEDPVPDPYVPPDPDDPTPTCQSPSLDLKGAVDFDTAMQQANEFASTFSSLLNGLSFDPAIADANGPYDHTNNAVVPNGIPDIKEFYLISVVLNNPDLDLRPYGGIDYGTTLNAWNRNVLQMADDLGEKARTLVKGSETVLPGYTTLGDDDSCYIPTFIADLAIENMPFLEVKPIDLNKYVRLTQYFSANGDADGDGTKNIDEYNLAVADNNTNYALYALDPCNP